MWIDVLVACTLGWEGLGDKEGPLAFTPENARRLYIDYPVIREQVDNFVGNRGNFLNG